MTAPFKSPQPTGYPYWPFSGLALYTQVLRDLGSYTQALTQCTDAMEAMRAEGVLGLRLMDDMMRAYADLAVLPWTAMASALSQQDGETGRGRR